MGSRRTRFAAFITTLAALLLSIAGIITAGPAFANAANPLPTTTGNATVAPNGDVTVTVSGTWSWLSQTCTGRFGTGWAVAWGDPNEPGNPVPTTNPVLLVGTPTDNTVHYNLLAPLGTCGLNGHPTGPWTDTHTYKAGTPIGDICVNMYDLHKSPADQPNDFIAGGPNHNKDNSVETNDFDPNSNTSGFCFKPAKIKIHKVDNHQPPNPLGGAQFGLWAGNAVAGNPVLTCTSAADGTCDFSVVNPGDYTIHEISAPAGYSPDANDRQVTVAKGQDLDVTQPFVDPRDTGWARIVKVLQDNNGNPVTVADKHVLDGASFVLYSDKNNNGALDAGETAKLWPDDSKDAACTISGGTGQCDIGPVLPGAYRVHETATPPNMTTGPDVNVTVVKSTHANPAIVNYANIVGALDINLVKSGPALAHVGDTFTYTFDATTNGPRLHNIQLQELAPNRCTTPISAATGDTNSNGFLEKGETWHWTCDHTVTAGDPNPLPNTAKVTGTDDFGRQVSATDDHSVIIIHPAIKVEKSGPATAHEGDTVTYTFKVTNIGDAALSNVQVVDDKLGNIGTIALLSAGDSQTLTKDFSVPAGNAVDNTVTACGIDPLSAKVCDDDHHHLVIVHPGITIVKSGPATAHVGDTVTYTFAVTNTGDNALTNVQVTDDKLGSIGTIASLAVNETKTLSKTYTVPDVPAVDNTATACGTDALQKQVCDDDHHHLVPIHPKILVEKSGPATAHVADVVTYTFKVTNTGDVDLSNVAVTDDKVGSVGTIPSLAVGASTTLTKDFTVPNVAAVDNTVTACGTDPLSLKVCDDDHHHLVTIHPAITVDKTAASQAHEGDKVTYTFAVKNTGDVALTNVAVTDDILGPIGTIGDLAVGESKTLTKDFTVPTPSTSAIVNTATACGDDPLQKEVCDHHDHHLDPIHPAIHIVKSGPALAHVGDTITYKFEVTNPGDVPLHDVVLTDPKCNTPPTIVAKTGTGDNILDLEDHWFYTCDHNVTASDPDPLPNTGTVTGIDPLDKTVTDKSSHTVDIIHPAIKVEKSGPAEAHEGDTVTYTFKVTNTGDVALSNVTVVDDKLGDVGTISSLDVNDSTTLSKDFKVPSPSTGVDNTVTACGTDPLSAKVCDDDHHHLTPKHPAITVVKSGPATATAGQTVTYTFKVTNTGDIDLKNVQVNDDKLGSIGTVPSLAIGESQTLTKDLVVPSGQTAIDNTVTACGTDTLSLQVCAQDKHHMDVTQVLGENVVRPSAPLAVTGADLGWRSLVGLLLLGFGVGLRVIRRRNRRSEA
jgi:uncharacterized repeat protein (TIGR01451 family)